MAFKEETIQKTFATRTEALSFLGFIILDVSSVLLERVDSDDWRVSYISNRELVNLAEFEFSVV